MRRYVVEGRDSSGVCRAKGTFMAAEPGEAMWDAQFVMRYEGICSYAVYRPGRLRRRPVLVTVASGGRGGPGGDGDGGLAGVREPRRPTPGPGHLSAALDPPV
jgi:hypothetical protein